MVTNADVSQTAMTLAQLGITQINLKTDAIEIRFADGSVITGQSTFVRNGVVQTAGAVTLVTEADGKRSCRRSVGDHDLCDEGCGWELGHKSPTDE